MNEYDKRNFFILLGLSFFLTFFCLASSPIIESFEGPYISVTESMLKSGTYLVSRNNDGEMLFFFQPAYFWLQCCLQLIGVLPEWCCRIPSALAVAMTAFIMYLNCTRLFDERVGFWACLVTVSMAVSLCIAKLSYNGPFFVLTLSLVIFSYLRSQYFLFSFLLAVSGLIMGVFGFVFPLTVIFFHSIFTDKTFDFFRLKFFACLLLGGVILSPWFCHMYNCYGQEFVNGFLSFRSIVPLSVKAGTKEFWYYFPVLLLALAPWTGIIINCFYSTIFDSKYKEQKQLLIFHVWWIIGLFFLTFYPYKSACMIWLIAPPWAVLIGWNIFRLETFYNRYFVLISYIFSSLAMLVILCGVWYNLGQLSVELHLAAQILIVVTLSFSLAAIITLIKIRDIQFFGLLHVGWGVTNMLFLFIYFVPVLVEKNNLQNHIMNLFR